MGTPVEPAEHPKPKQRWSRLRLAVVILFVIASLLGIDAYRRDRRTRWLVSEIDAANGSVRLPESLPKQFLSNPWREFDKDVFVHLRRPTLWKGAPKAWGKSAPPAVDAAWLQAHHYLAGLRVTSLMLGELPVTRTEYSQLFTQHPIEDLTYTGVEGADEVATALNRCQRLRRVEFSRSDLSDEGFRALPLEELTELGIAYTELTPVGLNDFKRCRQLTSLSLDGKQLDIVVPELLAMKKTLDTLDLYGPGIEDRHLAPLYELKPTILYLTDTNVSEKAVEELQRRLPDCSISR